MRRALGAALAVLFFCGWTAVDEPSFTSPSGDVVYVADGLDGQKLLAVVRHPDGQYFVHYDPERGYRIPSVYVPRVDGRLTRVQIWVVGRYWQRMTRPDGLRGSFSFHGFTWREFWRYDEIDSIEIRSDSEQQYVIRRETIIGKEEDP